MASTFGIIVICENKKLSEFVYCNIGTQNPVSKMSVLFDMKYRIAKPFTLTTENTCYYKFGNLQNIFMCFNGSKIEN